MINYRLSGVTLSKCSYLVNRCNFYNVHKPFSHKLSRLSPWKGVLYESQARFKWMLEVQTFSTHVLVQFFQAIVTNGEQIYALPCTSALPTSTINGLLVECPWGRGKEPLSRQQQWGVHEPVEALQHARHQLSCGQEGFLHGIYWMGLADVQEEHPYTHELRDICAGRGLTSFPGVTVPGDATSNWTKWLGHFKLH